MVQTEKLKGIPRGTLIGFIGPIVSFICILVSIAILPGFDWSSNALSDLGSWFRTDLGELQIVSAAIFNGGLIITGFMILYFIIWLVKQIGDTPSKVALLFFAGTAILLAGVGIFSVDYPLGHIWTAVPFFFSIPIALALTGVVWIRLSEMRVLGSIAIFLSFISLLIMFQPWIDLSIAVFERLESLVAMGWLWSISYMHYTGRLLPILNTSAAQSD